jgi:hypothetical protein
MEDDVWKWVDRDAFVKERVLREYSQPSCKKKSLSENGSGVPAARKCAIFYNVRYVRR